MLLDREGVFHAYPIDIGIADTGPNNLATATIAYAIVEEKQNDEFVDVSSEGLEINGYHYLEKRDGDINEHTFKALREATGWDGVDPFWLQDTDLSQHAVQITCAFNTYNGKRSIKVNWLNAYGSEGGGGITRADATQAQSIRNRLGSKFRALAGSTPVQQPPKPAGRPTAPVAPTAPVQSPSEPPAPPAPMSTLNECWAMFTKTETGDQDAVQNSWFALIADKFGDVDADALTPEQCGELMEAISEKIPY